MTTETVDTLIVGGGQAGLAMSEHLSGHNVPHLVLERHRIAERWRTERWDSLVANGPAWHDRFPSLEFNDVEPDAFASKDQITEYFEAYAELIRAPVRCGVNVLKVCRNSGRSGFHVETSDGVFDANNIVAATGPFQVPLIPPLVGEDTEVTQIHSRDYHNPQQLPDGSVLVVGAGSSGSQIADELLRAGRSVYLSVGPHDLPPRRYRGQDFVWWLGVLGKWDVPALEPGLEHVTIAVSGAYGGVTVDFRRFAARGMTLLGRAQSFNDGTMHFAPDLAHNIARGNANTLSVLDQADAYVERNGLDLPLDPTARIVSADPQCVTEPITKLSLTQANIGSIIWATGYTVDFSWLKVDALDESGQPKHERGISSEPGVYFLGLPWLSSRASSFIWGVWHDARFLADHIAIQRQYLKYRPARIL